MPEQVIIDEPDEIATDKPEGTVPAGLMRRLCAMLYDGLLSIAILMLGGAIAIGVRVAISGAEAATTDPMAAAHGLLLQLWLVLLLSAFFVFFWRRNGQTLGMQAWRLQVRNRDGSMLTVKQCLLRLAGGLMSWACLGLGYWLALFSPTKTSWSDRLSNSECVLLPKQKK